MLNLKFWHTKTAHCFISKLFSFACIYFVLVDTSYATTNINNTTNNNFNAPKMETTYNYYDKDKINSINSFASSEISSECESFTNSVSSGSVSSSTASKNSSSASGTQSVSSDSDSSSGTIGGFANNNSETLRKTPEIQNELSTISNTVSTTPKTEFAESSSITSPVNSVSSDDSSMLIEENTNLKGTIVININTATAEELATYLPGIGEVTAALIIEYRNENGAFNSVDELINIKGIGEKKLEQVRNYVAVD